MAVLAGIQIPGSGRSLRAKTGIRLIAKTSYRNRCQFGLKSGLARDWTFRARIPNSCVPARLRVPTHALAAPWTSKFWPRRFRQLLLANSLAWAVMRCPSRAGNARRKNARRGGCLLERDFGNGGLRKRLRMRLRWSWSWLVGGCCSGSSMLAEAAVGAG